ncbi:mitoferrin-2-like [Branchiostoma floridae]|uniref:Mitoferrin-2-like n=1 Tax=Branchiostoma floridae TaxID=7739 RepID=C3XZT1_BRAFL|nr:mitoferrin-2-like [Branchiostoma floridae]|eukprot:XP_002610469.1 hypothetical protein BRAFLDRAFT_124272 [Branchiostoma floridae]
MDPDDPYESLPKESSLAAHLGAGALAGMAEHCIMYPVDSVKTRMQSIIPEPGARYRSIAHAFKTIIRQEGLLRPVRGVSVVAAGAGPAHALYFSCYEQMKRTLGGNSRGMEPGHYPVANGAAGCIATVFHDASMNPVDVVKQRLQMYGSPYKGAIDCFRTVLRTEGVGAFYRSFTTQLTMNLPFQSIHFMVYEFMQEHFNPSHEYNPETHLVSGAMAGAVAAAITTPLDVCKTLLNTQEKRVRNKKAAISGMVDAFRTVYRVGGFFAYFKGVRARVVFQMPATAISWSVYELFKHLITKQQRSALYAKESGRQEPKQDLVLLRQDKMPLAVK